MADRQFQPREALEAFVDATHWWVEDVLPNAVGADLDAPGLGEWSVAELIAHTTRAFTTTVDYIDPAPADGPDLLAASAYWRKGLSTEGVNEAVAERARSELAGMDDVIAVALERADTALQTVGATLPNATVHSPLGDLRFDQYLVTRTVEIVVHGLDLAAALEVDLPAPASATSVVIALLGECVRNDAAASATVIRALTGRSAHGSPCPFDQVRKWWHKLERINGIEMLFRQGPESRGESNTE